MLIDSGISIDNRAMLFAFIALGMVWLIILRLRLTIVVQEIELDAVRAALASRRDEARSRAGERASQVKPTETD